MSRVRITKGVLDLDSRTLQPPQGDPVRLTTLDTRLLCHLVARAPDAATREELLVEVWGYAPTSQTEAIERHVSRLRRKIETDPRYPAHLLTEHGVGYRWVGPAASELAHRMRPSWLPALRGPFVGRTDALNTLHRHLNAGDDVVSIVGVGGLGKTRLALELLHSRQDDPPDGGLWFVDLSTARDEEAVLAAVAGALRLRGGAATGATIADTLASAGPTWIVLDNAEQVAESVGALLEPWRRRAPQVSWIVTSREPLQLGGEVVLRLGPLDRTHARTLWERHALRIGGQPLPNDAVGKALLAHLDGLPLAIELAACRTTTFSPPDLLAQLEESIAPLTSRLRGTSVRHASMEHCLQWSWDRLSTPQRQLMLQVAVFRGGFTIEDVAAVVQLPVGAPSPTALVESLVVRSLVRSDPKLTPTRFDLFPVVRQFAAQLLGTGRGAVASRHAAWFARFGEHDERAALHREPHARRLRNRDLPNLIDATDDRLAAGDGRLAAPLAVATADVLRSHSAPSAHRRVQAAIGLASVPPQYRPALHSLDASIHRKGGNPARSVEILQDLLDGPLPARERGMALMTLSASLHDQGHDKVAIARLHQAAEAMQVADDLWGLGDVLASLGALFIHLGRFDASGAALRRALPITAETGNRRARISILANLGAIAGLGGDDARAEHLIRQSLEVALTFDAYHEAVRLVGMLNLCLQGTGRHDEREALCVKGLGWARERGDPRLLAHALLNRQDLLAAQGRWTVAQAELDRIWDLLGRSADDNPKLGRMRAQVLAGRDQLAAAVRELERVLSFTGPDRFLSQHLQALLQLAVLVARQSDLARGQRLVAEARALVRDRLQDAPYHVRRVRHVQGVLDDLSTPA